MSAKDLIQLGSAYNSLPMLVAGSCLISLDGAPCLLLSMTNAGCGQFLIGEFLLLFIMNTDDQRRSLQFIFFHKIDSFIKTRVKMQRSWVRCNGPGFDPSIRRHRGGRWSSVEYRTKKYFFLNGYFFLNRLHHGILDRQLTQPDYLLLRARTTTLAGSMQEKRHKIHI